MKKVEQNTKVQVAPKTKLPVVLKNARPSGKSPPKRAFLNR
jgi:hypothetical protein